MPSVLEPERRWILNVSVIGPCTGGGPAMAVVSQVDGMNVQCR